MKPGRPPTWMHGFLQGAVESHPGATAIEEPSGNAITYAELGKLCEALRDRLVHLGVRRGDRVGVYLRKSIDSVASIMGILESGAAYVPVDPTAPCARNAYILRDCSVRVAIVEARFLEALSRELRQLGGEDGALPEFLVLEDVGGGDSLRTRLEADQKRSPAPAARSAESLPDDLAYVLYTSGSTGKPKGVMISHANGASFVEWCAEVFQPKPDDRFSSHAPFHFDLSILDLYVPMRCGATLVLVPEALGKEPDALAALIADKRLTIWYSAPSILAMLAQFGKLERRDYSSLRMILFAGEVFPLVHLRNLKRLVPHPRYFNLYGPTETNVCTYYELPEEIPEDRGDPFPIGTVCSHLAGIVVDTEGNEVEGGTEGELCIRGPSVTRGYWNLPEQTARAFLPAEQQGEGWYRTGDLVVDEGEGVLRYVGRRDRMVKKRGYRVELGEIEACLYRFPGVLEAATVALSSDEGVTIRAHLATEGGQRLSLIKLKRFCSENLPLYMVPDLFEFHGALPKTSTDKIDYQALKTH